MYITVLLDRHAVQIERVVFVGLLENSVANGRAGFPRALENSTINFSDLLDLARSADIPYSLFFAPLEVVDAQLEAKTSRLLQGLTKQSFSINSRNVVELRDIELIVKDLLRKQELLKKHDRTLRPNPIVGALRAPGQTIEHDAVKLTGLLGVNSSDVRGARNKDAATQLLIDALESRQILVAQSQSNYMPQLLRGVKLSGITIKDGKVPYIFLAGGDEGEGQEPAGRRTFTLILLTVLIARGKFAAVTYDGRALEPTANREYSIAAEILMPASIFKTMDVSSLPALRSLADHFKVTPSAAVVRASRLGLVSREEASAHLHALEVEYANRPKSKPQAPKPVNAVRRYAGRELSRRMLAAHDAGRISSREFCRAVCLNKIKPHQISEFRASL